MSGAQEKALRPDQSLDETAQPAVQKPNETDAATDANASKLLGGGATAGAAVNTAGDKAPPETEKLAGGTLWAKDPAGNDLPPSIDDVSQAGVNDCFVFAACASIANADPDRIKKMFKDNGNGTYTITFKGIGIFSSAEQTVSADFIKGKHGNLTARKALWPLLIELAYAQQKGGMEVLDKGGNAGTAIDDFTNDSASRFDPREKEPAWTLAKLATAHDKKYPTTMLTPKEEDASKEKKEMAGKTPNLHFWHGYVVTDVDAKAQRVKLFNPWGHHHPNGDGWVDIEVIHTFFIEVDINS